MRSFITIFLLLLVFSTSGQDKHLSSTKGQSSLGLGLGLPYGAIGGRFMTNVADNLGLFGGLGYHLVGVGYNFGLQLSFDSKAESEFYLTGMYGTNGVIIIEGLPEYDEVFTGASFGLGLKLNSRRTEGNYWDFGVLVPLHSKAFTEQIEVVKNDSRVGGIQDALPVAIVIGYNFNL